MSIICKACNEGTLELKTKTIIITELDVYEFHINTSFLNCNICGASIIPHEIIKEYRKDLTLKQKALYYN